MLWGGYRDGASAGHLVTKSAFHRRCLIYGESTEFSAQVYRGACTLKDWSNTTACPSQWCNNSMFLIISTTTPWSSKRNANLNCPAVNRQGFSNLWQCPSSKSWWCGNESQVTPCESVSNGPQSFNFYTSGSALGKPPVTSSSESTSAGAPAIASASLTGAPLSASGLRTSQSSAAITASVQKQHQTAPTTIGLAAGLGVPLGLAAIACIGFLAWRARRRAWSKSRNEARNEKPFGAPTSQGIGSEVPDTQIPWELQNTGQVELDTDNFGTQPHER